MPKRAVICVQKPELVIPQLPDYSLMIVHPEDAESRKKYLIDNSDYSLLITDTGEKHRNGSDYPDERLFWYTSGTTGDSKFCSFSQDKLDYSINQMIKFFSFTANDRYAGVMPIGKSHGALLYWTMERVDCERKYLSIKNIRSVPEYNPTFLSGTPTILKSLLRFKFDNLRFVRCASAPLSHDLYQTFQEHFDTHILAACGFTEACGLAMCNQIGNETWNTIGKPIGYQARVNNGHLEIKGPNVVVDGWYDTGDLAEQDRNGNFRLLGRSRDQINVKGIKLNPLSLESQLTNHLPEVGEVVIFGEDSVKCLYTGSVDTAKIKTFLKGLGQYCWPTVIEHVDQIPRSNIGKISRHFLNTIY